MKSEKVWPIGIVVAMSIFVAWMLAVVTVALRHRPQLTSEHYYAEGYNLRELRSRDAANAAIGWKVSVQPLPFEQAAMPLVQLTVINASGAPCDSLTGEVAFYRPSDQTLDLAGVSIFPVGAGKYMVKVPRPLERGSWQAVTHLSRGATTFDTRVNFFVDH